MTNLYNFFYKYYIVHLFIFNVIVYRKGYSIYFNNVLHFESHIIAYNGSDGCLDDTLDSIFETLSQAQPPAPTPDYDYCNYMGGIKAF
jgi:hypothetical protein